jgi:hypothetical protein
MYEMTSHQTKILKTISPESKCSINNLIIIYTYKDITKQKKAEIYRRIIKLNVESGAINV